MGDRLLLHTSELAEPETRVLGDRSHAGDCRKAPVSEIREELKDSEIQTYIPVLSLAIMTVVCLFFFFFPGQNIIITTLFPVIIPSNIVLSFRPTYPRLQPHLGSTVILLLGLSNRSRDLDLHAVLSLMFLPSILHGFPRNWLFQPCSLSGPSPTAVNEGFRLYRDASSTLPATLNRRPKCLFVCWSPVSVCLFL